MAREKVYTKLLGTYVTDGMYDRFKKQADNRNKTIAEVLRGILEFAIPKLEEGNGGEE